VAAARIDTRSTREERDASSINSGYSRRVGGGEVGEVWKADREWRSTTRYALLYGNAAGMRHVMASQHGAQT